jgi:hypothetical protein
MKLLLPVAGMSSRFPGVRPKYLLTFPDGQLMLQKSIEYIDFSLYDEVIIGPHSDHLEKYISVEQLSEIVAESIGKIDVKVRVLPISHSSSQADTCLQFSFGVKDCDNIFSFTPCEGNAIAYVDLNDKDLLFLSSPSSKSYIEIDSLGSVKTIVEKRVISNNFACGYYQFSSSTKFIHTAKGLIDEFTMDGHERAEVYISHCIFSMMTSGEIFKSLRSSAYYDFGDLDSFNDYNKSAMTLFCDFDGVIVKNSSKFDSPAWQFTPIEKNIQAIVLKLSQNTASKLVITTSRPAKLKQKIYAFLADQGLACADIVCDLPHSRRLLINDYANSNPHPSCSSVSIKRDADNLSDFLN